jgi:double-stranded uracil-DNA glycosylase
VPGGIADVLGDPPGPRLLLVGINPGLRSSELGQHFARPGNRFWPALFAAGITPRLLAPADQHELPTYGVGITNLAPRPSATAAELAPAELRDGAKRLESLVMEREPAVVAVLGLTAFRVAFGQPRAGAGRQADRLGSAELWVLPNPSGLNAHTKPADHAAGFRSVADAAGLPDYRQSSGAAAPNG